MYNPTPAAVAAPLLQQEHYLIQALQSSLAAPAQPQAQGLGQGLGQGFGQQPAQPAQEQALLPFPNLVAQVSAQQQPMSFPVQGPSELDLVHHNITLAAAPQAGIVEVRGSPRCAQAGGSCSPRIRFSLAICAASSDTASPDAVTVAAALAANQLQISCTDGPPPGVKMI